MKRFSDSWRRASASALTLLAVTGITIYLLTHGSDLQAMQARQPAWLGLLFGLTVLRVMLTAEMHRGLLGTMGHHLARAECFWLANVASAANLLLPLHGGTGLRAFYLKRRHGVSYRNFAAQLIGCQLLLAVVASLVAGLSLLTLDSAVAAATLLAAIVIFLVGLWSWKLRSERHTWTPRYRLIGLALALRAIDVAMFWSASQAAGWVVGAWGAAAVTSLGSLAALIQLTPGGLGTREAMVAAVSTAAGLSVAQAVAATLVVRGVDLLRAALLGGTGSWWLQRQLREPTPCRKAFTSA